MLHSDLDGPVNTGNPHELTVLELAKWIRDLAASKSEITFIPRPEDDPMVRQPDIALAQSELGWSPQVASQEGLKRTITWVGEHQCCEPCERSRQGALGSRCRE